VKQRVDRRWILEGAALDNLDRAFNVVVGVSSNFLARGRSAIHFGRQLRRFDTEADRSRELHLSRLIRDAARRTVIGIGGAEDLAA